MDFFISFQRTQILKLINSIKDLFLSIHYSIFTKRTPSSIIFLSEAENVFENLPFLGSRSSQKPLALVRGPSSSKPVLTDWIVLILDTIMAHVMDRRILRIILESSSLVSQWFSHGRMGRNIYIKKYILLKWMRLVHKFPNLDKFP